jgi:hypothetical protein
VLTQDAVAEILAATVTPPPEALRALGHALVEPAAGGLAGPAQEAERQPRQHQPAVAAVLPAAAPRRGFKFSTDPQLDAKVRDVIGLYLNSPDNAVVVCVDEKSQYRHWSGPSRSCRCGRASPSGSHDYARHGVTCPFPP